MLTLSAPAAAFEAFNGRVQAHGFFESQMRALNADYSEDWDVSQWYQVFNLELEVDLVQDSIGPIDLLSAYVRAEVRYDCVYSRGCGMFRSMNLYGDRSKSLPRRLLDADRVSQSGRIRVSNDPDLPDQYRNFVEGRETNTDPLTGPNDPVLAIFANGAGADGFSPVEICDLGPICQYLAGGGGSTTSVDIATVWPDNDNPYEAIAQAGGYLDFRFVAPKNQTGLGPWLPRNEIQPLGAGANVGNPFDNRTGSYALQASVYNGLLLAADPQFNPDGTPVDPVVFDATVLAATTAGQAAVGAGELPYRPVPLFREDGAAGQPQAPLAGDPRGLYLPTYTLSRMLNSGELDRFENDYNISEARRAWNRGASQDDEKELKEAYLDIETLDNRLWLRIGRQQIVWGKTELFRTTDQFNPTDAALASLPSLEESRIALWSARGVWSFYEVGPLDDVRLELAFNFDDFQQTDIGACGEAYSPNLTCQLTFGGFAHGVFGFGVAGVQTPPDPWQSLEGWEVGARLEWRYDRFSFALIDWYGYDDVPTARQITTFTRNVDPVSGRPRELFSSLKTFRPSVDPYTGLATNSIEQISNQGVCVTGLEQACLLPKRDIDGDGTIDGLDPSNGAGVRAVNVFEDTNGNGVLDPGEDRDGDGFLDLGSEIEGLTHSAAAQQIYAYICATTVGFTDLDRAACGLNVFGSQQLVPPTNLATVSQALGGLLGGSPFLNLSNLKATAGGFAFPFVSLNVGPSDLSNDSTNGSSAPCLSGGLSCGGQGGGLLPAVFSVNNAGGTLGVSQTVGGVLSPAQEALLGCGPYWGTQCDDDGIDLLTAEGSMLFQSWVGVEGTVQNNDITQLWLTNQKVTSPVTGGQVFAQQPGTRGWYFDTTRDHEIGPVCTTGNFGGALYEYSSDELENDRANGNQAILPGCRRKWKRDPNDPAFAGANQILALNLYGQDLACARERAANNGSTVTPGCAGLGDEDSARVDPRSWELAQDGEPDGIGMQHVNYTTFPTAFNIDCGFPAVAGSCLTPARLIGGTPTQAPDFFFVRPTPTASVFGTQAANPAQGAAFDACDEGAYSSAIIAEYGGAQFVPCGRGGHPMTGQPWASEMAAVSWNLMVLIVQLEQQVVFDEQSPIACPAGDPGATCRYELAREIFLNPDHCSFTAPELCETFRTLQGTIGLQRNVRKAGGNGAHGRRTFVWQSGGEVMLTYKKRNVLGFSMDFAEDVTKANFSFEFTYIDGVPVANRNQYDDYSEARDFNLTLSADRPTFINFLNSNRTFFFNWQFFMRYRDGWERGYTDEGAWSFLTTFAVATGYFQDRLTPSITTVYDVRTQSGALLTGISYRFTQNFSAAVGMAYFYGKPDQVDEQLAGVAPASNRNFNPPDDLYKSRREGGLAIVKDRDEVWAQIRYTF
jgi:hypothetical protein